jgi:hypothetical protein
MYSFFSGFFCFTFLAGLMVVIGDGIWYLRFRQAVAELGRYTGGFVISRCPTCSGRLSLSEDKTTRFGIPQVRRVVTCSKCASRLEGQSAGAWRWQVDEAANVEVAWLYDGETLTDQELQSVAAGGHTNKALAKIAEREEQRRQAARAAALIAITGGDLAALATLEDRLIEVPAGVQVMRAAPVATRLELQKDEICLLVMRPASLAEQRTKDNVPYAKTVDSGGEFVVTNRRYGYVGAGKSMQQKLDVITAIEAARDGITVARSNRKTPEHFTGLDGPLAAAVLRGAGRKV